MWNQLSKTHRGVRWGVLWCASAALAAVFITVHLPAAVLLACMLAGILLSLRGIGLSVAPRAFSLAQAVLGCLIASSLQPSVLRKVGTDWPLFLGFAVSVIGVSALLGWAMMRRRIFPGTTAVWGLMPGGASAMVLMSGDFGADMRLVAFMQYLRVVLVTALASIVARVWAPHPAAASVAGLASVQLQDLGLTLTIVLVGAQLARRLRIPAGAMLVPLLAATVLQGFGAMRIALPPVLLALAYGVIGWSIGLRFTVQIVQHAWRALPAVMGAILVLIGLGLMLALGLARLADFGMLTAYLATSPGGADSVAVIAATSAVDAGFVMAMQVARMLMVIAIGPRVSKWVSAYAKR